MLLLYEDRPGKARLKMLLASMGIEYRQEIERKGGRESLFEGLGSPHLSKPQVLIEISDF